MKKTVTLTTTNKTRSDRTLRDLKEERALWKRRLASLKPRKNRSKHAGDK
jgi:hypothetical protein